MTPKLLTVFIVLITILQTAGAVSASTTIGGCSTLSTPGETYLLTASIYNSASNPCMSIAAENVTLDCQGNTIDSNGVAANGITGAANGITVKNCELTDWAFSALQITSNYSNVSYNTLRNNYNGLLIYGSYNSTVSGNTIDNTSYSGLSLTGSNNIISGNTVTNTRFAGLFSGPFTVRGDYNTISGNTGSNNVNIGLVVSGRYNNITGNTLNSNGQAGIYSQPFGAYLADNNIYTSNTANNNGLGGIVVVMASNNIFNSNTVNNASVYGIAVAIGSNNTFTGNTVNNASIYGIAVAIGSNNTFTSNTVSNSHFGIFVAPFYGGAPPAVSENNTVTSNTISNTNYGIAVAQSNNNVINSNTVRNSNPSNFTSVTNETHNSSSSGPPQTINVNTNVNAPIAIVNITGVYLDDTDGPDSGWLIEGLNYTVISPFGPINITSATGANSSSDVYLISYTYSNYEAGILLLNSTSNSLANNNIYNNSVNFWSVGSSANTFNYNVIDGSNITFSFSGDLSLTKSNPPGTVPPSTMLPLQQRSLGNKYLNITNGTATSFNMTLYYTDAEIRPFNESSLNMYRWNGTDWSAVPGTALNMSANTLAVNLSQFSLFGPFAYTRPPISMEITLRLNTTGSSYSGYIPGVGEAPLATLATGTKYYNAPHWWVSAWYNNILYGIVHSQFFPIYVTAGSECA